MLIVSRKIQESIVVGEFDGFDSVLKVTVLETGDGKVKLGFEVVSNEPGTPVEEWRRNDALEAIAYSQPDEIMRPSELRELYFNDERDHLISGDIYD